MPRQQLIKIRTGSSAPTAADFQTSEPAWDSTNKKLYVKAADGTMVEINATAGPGVPTGGTTGQVLMKSSATNYDAAWQTPWNGYAVGNWISPIIAGQQTGATTVAGNIYLMPFLMPRSISVSDLGARVATAASGASFQLAIYASTNGLPSGTPLASTGNLSGATATTVSASVTGFNLVAGSLYWMATNTNAGIALQNFANNGYTAAILGTPNLSDISQSNAITNIQLVVAQTFGTWPNLTGASTSILSSTNNRGAAIFMKVGALL